MSKRVSPVGTSVADHIKESSKDPEFKAEHERLAPYEALARIVLMRRGALGLTQAELAARMGTTASAISRIESGRHATSPPTLKKLAVALGVRAVLGFEFGSVEHPEQELVVLWSDHPAWPLVRGRGIDSLDLDGCCLAAAAMMVHWPVAAHLGFAATAESARGRGCHLALLHRAILDADERYPTLFVETCEPLGERDGPSAGCRNLLRAGFRQASVRPTWRRG